MSPDGFRSGRTKATRSANDWPADLFGLVNGHLIAFANEYRWTPGQVWALELCQLVTFCAFLDELKAERKRRAKGKR